MSSTNQADLPRFNPNVPVTQAQLQAALIDIQYQIGQLSPYKVYRALLSQEGTNAPSVIVLGQNTIGLIVWSRIAAGDYRGTLAGSFVAGKTFLILNTGSSPDGGFVTPIYAKVLSNDAIRVIVGPDTDDALLLTPIEILVFN